MKKLLILFSIFCAIFSFPCFSVLFAKAEAQEIVFSDNIKYFYFAEPQAICVNADTLAVIDGSDLILFDDELNFQSEIELPYNCYQIKSYENHIYALSSEGILCDDELLITGNFTDFDICEKTLYLVEGSKILAYSIAHIENDPSVYNIGELLNSVRYTEIETITINNDLIYFTVPGHINKNLSDIYRFDILNNEVTLLFRQREKIQKLLFGSNLIAQTNRGIVCYESSFDDLKISSSISDDTIINIAVFENDIYFLDLLGTIKKLDSNMNITSLIASASNEKGFYNMPVSVFTKNNSIIVSDYFNNRIAITDNKDIRYINNISSPIATAVDNEGKFFVAHNNNNVTIFDVNFNRLKSFTLPYRITNIFSDSFNNVFIVTGKRLFLIEDSNANEIALDKEILNIYSNANNGKTYISTPEGIYRLVNIDNDFSIDLVSPLAPEIFAIDDNENIFTLENDLITKYENEVPSTYETKIGASFLFISTIKNNYVNYGDMLVVSPITHSIQKIPYSEIKTSSLPNNFTEPDITSPNSLKASNTPLIRILDRTANLYSAPYDSNILRQVNRNQRVIVDYAASTDCFSLVFFIDSSSHNLYYGYIYTEALSDLTYEYTAPIEEQAVIYNDNTPIYKYPSVYSAVLRMAHKDETVDFMDFAAIDKEGIITEGYYLDDQNYKWYRIQMPNECEGYILASDLSLNKYKPDLYPQVNGTIIENNGISTAMLYGYNKTTDQYYPLSEYIKTGTRIEILDLPFDPSVEYCRILYHKDGYGTLECYVPSEFVRYDSKNSVQYIALAIIICCILLGFCTYALIRYSKRHIKLK